MDKRYSEQQMRNLWVSGFLDHEKQSQEKNAGRELVHYLRGLTGGVKQKRRHRGSEKDKINALKAKLTKGQLRRVLGRSAGAPRLGDRELMRLKEIADEALMESKAKRTSTQRGMGVYKSENKKLRKAILSRHAKMKGNQIRSRAIEDYFELVHHTSIFYRVALF